MEQARQLLASRFCRKCLTVSVTNSFETPYNRAFSFSVLGSEHAARHVAARRDAGRRKPAWRCGARGGGGAWDAWLMRLYLVAPDYQGFCFAVTCRYQPLVAGVLDRESGGYTVGCCGCRFLSLSYLCTPKPSFMGGRCFSPS